MRIPTIISLIATCLAVGMVMVALQISPTQVYETVGDTLFFIWTWVIKHLQGAWGTALIWGASIVLPIWFVVWIGRVIRSRSKNPPF